jgi:alanine racemase
LHQKPTESAALVLAIDLGALTKNWLRLADISAPAETSAVVKADAYGIGIEPAVAALSAVGCRTFFVALPEEGRRVRAALAHIKARATTGPATIYVLNGFFADWGDVFRANGLRPVLNTFASVEAWAKHFPGAPSALQVDTGMNRLGLSVREALELARRRDLLAAASPQLLLSHLACADEPDNPMNRSQLALFNELRAELPALPASLANSAGIHLGPDFRFDLVRPGIALYGAEFSRVRPPLLPVVTARARVLQVREALVGETLGYGAAKHLERDTRIAVLSAGYADGYQRLAGSTDTRPGAFALVRGRPAPLLGRVSMDLIAIDVTEMRGVTEGDFVELFGPNLPIDDIARAADTIGYELLTGLSRRAERVYLGTPLPTGEGIAEGDG